MIATKALRILISVYPLLKIERLSVGTEVNSYKALIRYILIYDFLAWESRQTVTF